MGRLEKIVKAVEKSLSSYRMRYTHFLDDESGYQLADALTPPGQESVELGLKERELLAEYIAFDVKTALDTVQPSDAALVEVLKRSKEFIQGFDSTGVKQSCACDGSFDFGCINCSSGYMVESIARALVQHRKGDQCALPTFGVGEVPYTSPGDDS